MKNNKSCLKKLFSVLVTVFIVLTFSLQATALTLDCAVEDIPLIGMPVNAYLIKDEHGKVADAYKNFNIDFSFSNAEESRKLAFTLEAYTLYNSISPTASAVTDQNGKVHFDNLENGLYLILIPRFEQNGVAYVSEPSLVMYNEKDEQLTVIPKISPSDSHTQTLKVLKIWDDDNNGRPDKITVILLCDGKKYSTVTLSEENNWRYTWKDLPSNHHWTIVELDVDGYTVEMYLDGITFVIKNTKDTPTTPPTTDSDEPTKPDDTTKPDSTTTPSASTTKPGDSTDTPERLPQTGQLWWPVPILFILGIMFIILGLLQRKGEHYEK